jgi:hypothetical protein
MPTRRSPVVNSPIDRLTEALELVQEYGGIDGAHHKQWLLDQIVRILADSGYDAWVADYQDGEDGPDTYEWDTGIPP